MNFLKKSFLALAIATSSVSMPSIVFASKINLDQRVASSVTANNGAGLFQIVDYEEGLEVIQRVSELPRGTRFTFIPNNRIERPLVVRENNVRRASPGGYYGSIIVDIKSLPKDIQSSIAELNTQELFIYEWSVDKSDFLRQVFDIEPTNKFDYKETFQWDRISTKGHWTGEAARLIQSSNLLSNPPSDVTDFCPNYHDLEADGQTAFWIHLLNSIARRESAFDPMVGNDESSFGSNNQGVISRGLLQISYGSIGRPYRNAGCTATSAADLHNVTTNLECGVAIFNHWIDRDNCISCQDGNAWRGIARYWSTVRDRYTVSCSVCASGEATIGYKDQIIKEIQQTQTCSGPQSQRQGSVRRFFNRLSR